MANNAKDILKAVKAKNWTLANESFANTMKGKVRGRLVTERRAIAGPLLTEAEEQHRCEQCGSKKNVKLVNGDTYLCKDCDIEESEAVAGKAKVAESEDDDEDEPAGKGGKRYPVDYNNKGKIEKRHVTVPPSNNESYIREANATKYGFITELQQNHSDIYKMLEDWDTTKTSITFYVRRENAAVCRKIEALAEKWKLRVELSPRGTVKLAGFIPSIDEAFGATEVCKACKHSLSEHDDDGCQHKGCKCMEVHESVMSTAEVQRIYDECGDPSETELLCGIRKLKVNGEGQVISYVTEATEEDDSDILAAVCQNDRGEYHFERAKQDRRLYYRLVSDKGNGGGSLTDAKHARETIKYWREKGWLNESVIKEVYTDEDPDYPGFVRMNVYDDVKYKDYEAELKANGITGCRREHSVYVDHIAILVPAKFAKKAAKILYP